MSSAELLAFADNPSASAHVLKKPHAALVKSNIVNGFFVRSLMPKIGKPNKSSQLMVGEAIRQQRRRLGMTQGQLAAIIKAQSDSISRIERGHHQPSLARLAKIAAALEVSLEALIARSHHSPRREILILLKEVESLPPEAQSFVLESLRHHIAFFARESQES